MKKIYVITGQTATGKTSYAIELAKKINGELINCDSRQIYKGLDIITGKDLDKITGTFTFSKQIDNYDIGYYSFRPTADDQQPAIPIWLYDIISPDKSFSTFDYRNCAIEVLRDIFSRNKTPIFVGGTYFYLKHLLYGTVETFVEPDQSLRTELENKTVYDLQNILKKLNPELFNKLNNSEKHNPHRLIRKIEISNVVRHPEFISRSNEKQDLVRHDEISLLQQFPDLEIEITGFVFSSKELLQQTITKRVEQRLSQGAIEEVQTILTTYSPQDPGLKTIGYSQIIAYLQNKISFDEMKQIWITKEVQYAKRQLTFMNQNPDIDWQEI